MRIGHHGHIAGGADIFAPHVNTENKMTSAEISRVYIVLESVSCCLTEWFEVKAYLSTGREECVEIYGARAVRVSTLIRG